MAARRGSLTGCNRGKPLRHAVSHANCTDNFKGNSMSHVINRRALFQGAAAGAFAATVAGTSAWRAVAAAATKKPAIGNWGFDLDAMDRAVSPGDDFFRFAGGTWMKNTQIPADRSRWGSFDMLQAK